MKNIILILMIGFLVTSFTFENEKPAGDGSTYHVMARSGLKMRDLPSLQGEKILTIPYNGQVVKIEDGIDYGDFTVEELKDFKITDKWVKVQYNGKEGFVFGGYLTQIPLPSKNSKNDFYDYLETKLKVSSNKYDFEKFFECEPSEVTNCICAWRQKYYNDKVTYYTTGCAENGNHEDLTVTDFKISEIYNIARIIYDRFNDYGFETKYIYHKREDKIEFRPKGGGVGSYLEITKKGKNQYFVNAYGGC